MSVIIIILSQLQNRKYTDKYKILSYLFYMHYPSKLQLRQNFTRYTSPKIFSFIPFYILQVIPMCFLLYLFYSMSTNIQVSLWLLRHYHAFKSGLFKPIQKSLLKRSFLHFPIWKESSVLLKKYLNHSVSIFCVLICTKRGFFGEIERNLEIYYTRCNV